VRHDSTSFSLIRVLIENDCIGGIRTIPPGFTRGLDFGPQTQTPQDGELLEEEVEEVEVQPIYRPMFDRQSEGRASREVRRIVTLRISEIG